MLAYLFALTGALALAILGQVADDRLLALLTQGGAVAVLALAALAYTKEWIVSGRTHRRELHDKDTQIQQWRELGLHGIEAARTSAGAIEKVTDVVAGPALRGISDQDLLREMRNRGLG